VVSYFTVNSFCANPRQIFKRLVPFVSTFVLGSTVIWLIAEPTEVYVLHSPSVYKYMPTASFQPKCKPSIREDGNGRWNGYVKLLKKRLKIEKQLRSRKGISERESLKLDLQILDLQIGIIGRDLESRLPYKTLLYLEECPG